VRDTAATLEQSLRNVIVLGYLNQYEDEPALTTLQSGPAALTNLWNATASATTPTRRRTTMLSCSR
jgi:hypothetical protein